MIAVYTNHKDPNGLAIDSIENHRDPMGAANAGTIGNQIYTAIRIPWARPRQGF